MRRKAVKLSPFAWPLALLVTGCVDPRPTAPRGACVTAAAAAAAASAPAPTPSSDERFYPGGDDARTTPRRRYRTAVLLFAPPRSPATEPLEVIDTLSFQPLVCAIDGVLAAGTRCGEVMPRKVTVRLTSTSSGDETMEVMRGTAPFVRDTEDGPVTLPAPYAPSCCMYKRCVGRTIPYRPAAKPGSALATAKTILAVWPADAEIDLRTADPSTDNPAAHTWTLQRIGARKLLEIATSDIDHDGKTESFVYETWANDYGLDVLVRGTGAPVHAFSCGNI